MTCVAGIAVALTNTGGEPQHNELGEKIPQQGSSPVLWVFLKCQGAFCQQKHPLEMDITPELLSVEHANYHPITAEEIPLGTSHLKACLVKRLELERKY